MLKRILLGAALLAGCTNDVRDVRDPDDPAVAVAGEALSPDEAVRVEQLAADADVVFVGEVVAVAHQVSQPDRDGLRLPFTLVTWRVDDALKGTRERMYTARFLGGPLGDKTLRVAEIPQFAVGDRDMMFVRDNGGVGCPLAAGAQGRVRIGAKPDGMSPSAPSARWLTDAAHAIRTASAGAAVVGAPDLDAPFVFDLPRPATREEKLAAAARARAQLARPARPKTAEELAYEANHHNPILAP